MIKIAGAVLAAIAVAACQSSDRAAMIYYDQYNHPLPQPLTVVHTGADGNGTPMLTLVGQYDHGSYRLIYGGTGEDYFAGFVRGGLAGAFEGAGLAGFGALLRPAKTVISNTASSAGSSATAAGGSAVAHGGSASLNAKLSNSQSQHQNATATSEAAASTGPVNVNTGGGIIPNGTLLHTPAGDIRVDPTVSVSQ